MGKNKKYRGHYCWCCGCVRANEKFSGKGHRLHVCKECQKLGKEELAFRQHQRDIDRLLDWDGRIRRKSRAVFERYLTHNDKRVRAYAEKISELSEQRRKELHEIFRAEREEEERMLAEWQSLDDSDGSLDYGRLVDDETAILDEQEIEDLDEIPF